ncbi:Fe-S cluster assembly protein SufB [candidate division WWE3 bacterium RIFOXYC1_FULL_40_10]|uniref:Fe-S cluster assembly protein SufB n=1 Tax=candidate division WWE3 bacterium RIFOXYA2_FULL_46_9 TaxID=1802636 RepID=A0A1F4W1A1_UNCKA|nr:MAG: Fe-S cluster assembly protein SufB [candidate division WWE3 bacterium RIFOXYB1_FULL_40_22]OGC61284.1 MAG: Fe-S cluster assembly protein SufB [candidate division WWE3 bacterium RIFOXYA1_FULL_40_11]OGC63194.1 MAG: Fe-S cluster assembly protein SufB [candidate division WWE3 bacterium RIFOXYA2_FULL_46_9]OGC65275.1 MAG: Fe-S cluster assembly protein SufB [candidate division WWE3 bacterium RIFOXYB2_FULL_41_6]OGC65667.1 MAG: Fe-S cluster assembly protein SufB [candidate division WWE3 bacterium
MKNLDLRSNYKTKYGFSMKDSVGNSVKKGLSEDVVKFISQTKSEPQWMLDYRLQAYNAFLKREMPTWGADLSSINFADIIYYKSATGNEKRTWEEVPEEVKQTFERLGVPQAEREFLAGVKAQYDSEVAYSSLMSELEDQGVIFVSTDEALKKYPELFKQYFGTVIPANDNKFSSLNSAVWSGGSFVYIPKGVHVKRPLQAYFRINAEKFGQFERTLIIADEGSFASYSEGCTAPVYSSDSLHAAVVEVIVKPGARFRYTTIQNWSNDVYNLVTKRARVEENGIMEWIDGNLGAKVTMKYPSCVLVGEGARGEMLSIAYAGEGQHQDAGAKMIHLAPNTSSKVISKSVSLNGGRASYRGLIQVSPLAKNVKCRIECDALILDENSATDTFPVMRIDESSARIEHEATVSKVGEENLFYLMSRGLTEGEAMSLIVSGFIEPIVKELPMEYAVELNRLIELEMEGSVG